MSCCHGSRSKYLLSRRGFLGGVAGTTVAGHFFSGPASAAEPVRVGFPTSDHYAPVFVAKDKGFFDKAGLAVEYKPFTTSVPIIEGLASQSMDIGFLGTPGIISVSRKFPLTGVMGIALEGSGIVVKQGGIQRFEELAGRSVALPARGSIAHLLLLRALTNANVDPTRVRIVEIGDPEGLRLGLLRGEVDAVAVWEPWVSQFEQTPELKRLALSHDIWPDHQCDLMWVNTNFLKQRPDTVKAVIDAVLRGMHAIQQDFAGATNTVSTALKVPATVEQNSMRRQQYTHTLQRQNIGDQYALLTKVGIVKENEVPAWDRLVDPGMYAYANERWDAIQKGRAG